jgi:hypothetical protein
MRTSMKLALCVAAAAVFATGAGRVFAQAFTYTNAIAHGEWSSAATWSAGVPSAGPPFGGPALPAAIDGGRIVTLNSFANHTNLLDLGTIAGQTGTLTMSGGDLTITDPEAAEPNIPSLRVGQVAGSTGVVNLNDGQITIDGMVDSGFANGDLIIGDVGNGTWNQTGGSVAAVDEVIIGLADVSTGVVNISGGDFRSDGRSMLVGFDGNGTLNVSGTANVRANFDLFVGFVEGSTGNLTQSGGAIEAGFMFSNFLSGGAGSTANINMTGGVFNARIAYVLGQGNGTTTMTHSGGTINAITNNGDMVVADGDGNTSTYTISGTAQVNLLHSFIVGAFDGPEGAASGTVNQTGGTITAGGGPTPEGRDGLLIGRDGNGVWNLSGGTINATNTFLGDFDSSNGTLNISGGTLNLSGNLNVGAAIASNADNVARVEPGQTDPQGQALDANGTLNVIGTGGTINVAGNLLANPDDKGAARNDPGEENDSLLKFTLGSTGVSTIDVGLLADLDGAVIDIDDTAGFFAANPAASLTLIDAAGGFGNVYTLTVNEQAVGPAGAGKNFTLAPGDAGQFNVQIVPSPGGGERLVVSAGGGGFAADFDNDGDVDGNDLTLWRNNFGPANAVGDADNDGDTDGSDFLTWQRQVGSTSAAPAASSIPEPSAALLLGVALAAFAARRRN